MLRRGWGSRLDPSFRNAQGRHGAHFDGVALTYAQVAAQPGASPGAHRGGPDAGHPRRGSSRRRRAELGRRGARGVRTGHPAAVVDRHAVPLGHRSIPFITYEPDAEGIRRSRADHSYGYGDALRDGVVRPVMFLAYSGQMRWRTRAGDEIGARLGEPMTKDSIAQAWRTALDPDGEWMARCCAAADTRLSEVRRTVPDAGGLVIATDQDTARAYAGHAAGDHRRAGRRRALRRRRGLEADRGVRRGRSAVDGRGADGVRGRRRAPARGGRVRHRGLDAAVLRAGDRTVRAGAPARGRPRRSSCRRCRVLLGLAGEMEVERDHALGPQPRRATRSSSTTTRSSAANRERTGQ